MLFSSLLFLWLALPLVVIGSLWLSNSRQNTWLLFCSLILYAWGGVSYALILVISIVLNFSVGRWISTSPGSSWPLRIGVIINLGLLGVFKYADFVVGNFNWLSGQLTLPTFPLPGIVLPIGISFYTFQAISYLVDVHKGDAPAQRNLFRLGLYLSFFPQLIAGPIVRYQQLAPQLLNRNRSWEKFSSGCERFVIGLAKKVLLANNFGWLADQIFGLDYATMDPFTAWAGICIYGLQIYYDFSGYSDMAIGLGRMFGFSLPENFNFPFASRSIREFWQRWHITLGQWFRDYLYIPLGGSRGTTQQTTRNLLLVFLATGIWHGAGWSFPLWGLWHGLFISLERQRWFNPDRSQWGVIYALLVVTLGWVLFRTESLPLAQTYFLALFGGGSYTSSAFDWAYHWNALYTVLTIVGIAVATGVPKQWLVERLGSRKLQNTRPADLDKNPDTCAASTRQTTAYPIIVQTGLLVIYLLLFLLCTSQLVSDSYNPFIYFRF